jgi:hypothetical protein
VIVTREVLSDRAKARRRLHDYGTADIRTTVQKLVADYGFAELLDTGLIRPFAIGAASRWLGPMFGIILGDVIADVTFYAPAILFHERRERAARRQILALISPSGAEGGRHELEERVRLLSSSDIFAGVAQDDLEFFAAMFDCRELADGETLCKRGEVANEVFLIREGTIDVRIRPESPAVATLGRGALVGEYGIFTGERRTATLIAKRKAMVMTLTYPKRSSG